VEDEREIAVLEGHIYAVYSLAFDPNGGTLASGGMDGTVRLWDLKERKEVATFRGHLYGAYSVAFGPEGRLLAAGSGDGVVHLWDVVRLEEISSLKGHADHVFSVVFGPDGRVFASGGEDGTGGAVGRAEIAPTSAGFPYNSAASGGDLLLPLYPNPSNLRFSILFELARGGKVKVRIYDVLGRVVRTLDLGRKPPGRHIVHWDGRDGHGRKVGLGTYICSLKVGKFMASRRMTVIK